MRVEWVREKAVANEKKYGVSFEEATCGPGTISIIRRAPAASTTNECSRKDPASQFRGLT